MLGVVAYLDYAMYRLKGVSLSSPTVSYLFCGSTNFDAPWSCGVSVKTYLAELCFPGGFAGALQSYHDSFHAIQIKRPPLGCDW